MKSLFFILLLSISTNTCQQETKILYVSDQLVDCVGVAPQKCMLIKEKPTDKWRNFYGSIKGFNYEEGFLYKIKVKIETIKNPPADASNLKYTLIEILLKEKNMNQTTLTNKWKVIAMLGIDEFIKNPTIIFDQKDNRVAGFSGCNNYFGTFKTEDNHLSFDQMGLTRKMCPDMTVENTFINNLKKVDHYKIESEKLLVYNKNNSLLFTCELSE